MFRSWQVRFAASLFPFLPFCFSVHLAQARQQIIFTFSKSPHPLFVRSRYRENSSAKTSQMRTIVWFLNLQKTRHSTLTALRQYWCHGQHGQLEIYQRWYYSGFVCTLIYKVHVGWNIYRSRRELPLASRTKEGRAWRCREIVSFPFQHSHVNAAISTSCTSVTRLSLLNRIWQEGGTITVLREYVIALVFVPLYWKPFLGTTRQTMFPSYLAAWSTAND